MIYPLVIGTIIALWKVDPGTAGLAGTVTLLASAVGGWLGGYLADRIGRVKTLQLTILWFSVFSLVCAVRAEFRSALDRPRAARSRLRRRMGRGRGADGRSRSARNIAGARSGSVQSGWAVGWGLAVLSQAILFSYLPAGDRLALDVRDRRAARAAGVFSAPICRGAGDCRRHPAPSRMRAASGPALWEIFAGPILKTTILASLVVTGCQGGYYAITFWVPRFLTTERKLSIVEFDRLSRGADHRLVHRLSGRRLARRPASDAANCFCISRSARLP